MRPNNGMTSPVDRSNLPESLNKIADIASSIRKIEEYLILNDQHHNHEILNLFSEERSSFYAWLKKSYKRRSLREKFFNSEYFSGEAAWNIILDLAAARIEGKRISVTSACIASRVPSTTALRWISILEEDGMIMKETDFTDKRRTFVRISDYGMEILNRYFDEMHGHQRQLHNRG